MHKTMMATLLACSVINVWAQEASEQGFPSLYIGAALGQSHVNLDCEGTSRCERTDTGAKVLVGVAVNPMMAIEAAYVDFGPGRARGQVDGDTFDLRLKASGWLGALALRHEFHPQLHGVLRVGASALKANLTVSGGTGVIRQNDTALKPYVGLGLEFTPVSELQVIGSLDVTRASVDGESGTLRLLSIGLQYRY